MGCGNQTSHFSNTQIGLREKGQYGRCKRCLGGRLSARTPPGQSAREQLSPTSKYIEQRKMRKTEGNKPHRTSQQQPETFRSRRIIKIQAPDFIERLHDFIETHCNKLFEDLQKEFKELARQPDNMREITIFYHKVEGLLGYSSKKMG